MSKQIFKVRRMREDVALPLGKLVASSIPELCRGLTSRCLLLGATSVEIVPCFRDSLGEWHYQTAQTFPVVDGVVQHSISRKSRKAA